MQNSRTENISIQNQSLDAKATSNSLLALSEAFESFFEATSDAIILIDGQVFVECNASALKFFGCASKAELCGKTLMDFSPQFQPNGELSAIVAEKYIQTALQKGNCRFEWVYQNPDETKIWAEILLTAGKIQGKPIFQAVVRDMVERIVTQKALQDSEEIFRSLVSSIPGVFYRCKNDENWTIYFISESVFDLTGYPATDFIHNHVRTFASIIHPEDLEKFATTIQVALDRKQAYIIEYRILTADGTVKWLYEKGQGVFDSDGNLTWLDGTILDITQRQAAESALRQKQEQYRSIFEAVSDGIAIFDIDTGKFVEVNHAFCRIHGYEYNELIGLHPTKLIHPDSCHLFAEFIEKVQIGLEFDCEGIIIRKDRTPVEVEVKGNPIIYNNQLHGLSVIRDISEQQAVLRECKKIEAQLRISEQRFRDVSEAAGEYVWELDINGIYTFIRTFTVGIYACRRYSTCSSNFRKCDFKQK
jgi:PAS domain S-box-containing protein